MPDITAGHFIAGTIGVAMLRRWYADGDVNEQRMAELADVLERRDAFPFSLALNPSERELLAGYAEWSGSYDTPNPLIAAEEPAVRPILERFGGPGVDALDAACGTGRHAAHLAALGCTTTGVDQSPEMLALARAKVPAGRFEAADLHALPFADESFDLVVIALALCHLADPTRAIAELARVLRPGGALVVSDPHPAAAIVGGQAFYGGFGAGRMMTWVRNHPHGAPTWLRAFRAGGLEVEDCEEIAMVEEQIVASPVATLYPDAVRAALTGLPTLWVWVVRKAM